MKKDKKIYIPIYGYSGPTDGTYYINGEKHFAGEDFRTVKHLRIYKKAGFNVLLIEANDPYKGEDYQTSQLKKNMDMAMRVGLKTIVFDQRIHDCSCYEGILVGENGRFNTQEALVDYVKDCMKDYSQHPTFFGVMLRDEAPYDRMESLGRTMRAIKTSYPNAFAQCNLLPLMSGAGICYAEGGTNATLMEDYESYLETFLKYSESDYILTDSYPIVSEFSKNEVDEIIKEQIPMYKDIKGNTLVYPIYLFGLWKTAEFCKKHNLKMQNVTQSFEMLYKGEAYRRAPTKENVRWMVNVLLGFGIKQLAYFTYWAKQCNNISGEFFVDNASPMSRNGKKTKGYYAVQASNHLVNVSAPILYEYSYSALDYYVPQNREMPDYLIGLPKTKMKAIKTIETDGILLILEQKTKDGRMLYTFVNVEEPDANVPQKKVAITFNQENAKAYKKGKRKIFKDGKVSYTLKTGEAIFVEI